MEKSVKKKPMLKDSKLIAFRISDELKALINKAADLSEIPKAKIMRRGIRNEVMRIIATYEKA